MANNYPFDEVCDQAKALVDRGLMVHQKFTCSHCGARQTMDKPNVFYETGSCEECSQITNIRETGCNYMVVTRL